MNNKQSLQGIGGLLVLALLAGCGQQGPSETAGVDTGESGRTAAPVQVAAAELSDAQVEDIVRRSYQYVAMYNVNNKFAIEDATRTGASGWNGCAADTELKDHNLKSIARPNNDTLYIGCMLDLRKDPVILDIPAFDSKYVSLMATAYDHYVNIPMTTRLGDFRKPEKALFYTARTEGYKGEPVEGVDRVLEMSGDFVSAVFRVMPHGNEPERFEKIVGQMSAVNAQTLAEFLGGTAKPIDDVDFPPVGNTDAEVYENNLLEVMQFVFNHNTFDPNNEMDQGVLAAYKPLGIEPGRAYYASMAAKIDGLRFRSVAEQVQAEVLASMADGAALVRSAPLIFQPKGQTTLEATVAVSIIGPIGQPMQEAMYPIVTTMDGKPMNAMNDYVIRMTKNELPPAQAFWSLTLYDEQNGFFIPNERKKYSVGENAGMSLNEDGGIEVYIADEKPDGVPEENWLPINRKDENMGIILRIYAPDLENIKSWTAPKAEKIAGE